MSTPSTGTELSTLLRSHLSGTSFYDHELATVARLSLLKRRRRSAQASSSSSSTSSSSSSAPLHQTLSFASVVGAALHADGSAAATRARAQARDLYDQFLHTVREVASDGASEDLLYAAFIVYRALAAPAASSASTSSSSKKRKPSAVSIRRQLEQYFGPIDNAVYTRLVVAAQHLREWQEKHLGQVTGVSSPTSTTASSTSSKLASSEFGSGLHFTPLSQSSLTHFHPATPFTDDADDASFDYDDAAATTERLQLHQGIARYERGDYNFDWLRSKMEPFATFSQTGEAILSEHELALGVLRSLRSDRGDEELQAELISLIGYEGFDAVAEFLSNRSRIVADCHSVGRAANSSRKTKKGKKKKKGGPSTHASTPFASVSVQYKSTQRELREQKREERRMARHSQRADTSQQAEIDEERLEQQANLFKDFINPEDGKAAGAGAFNLALPDGTVRQVLEGREEVFVPPVIPAPLEEAKLVPISAFEPFARAAFRGIKRMNRVQSRCYECAYKSNNNMLVCAPTGAGKTNIAVMTILREVGQHLENGVLQRDMFKIVYVAPMKALAQEVTSKFSHVLKPLGIVVKELTGDTQLTKAEIANTQIIVTTPEKWDVITRKSGDGSLMAIVRLLIIDEVHLLHEDRGPVIEILVARTLRQVEASQKMCRIVGLSATLPNYADVAAFCRVNPAKGLFFFGNEYRPVPLSQTYIGVTEPNPMKRKAAMNTVAYEKAAQSLREGHQVMIFVHSRRDTVKTAQFLVEMAHTEGDGELFSPDEHPRYNLLTKKLRSSRNAELKELVRSAVGVHHAGMLRSDRRVVEEGFKDGVLRLLVCTATLAWGVNLPAHTVVIKGTQIYDAKRGGWVEMGMQDVMQIFGRAGRPQYDTTGEAFIITNHDKLAHYLSLLNHQMPIESQFIKALPDHLNAEVVLGTVSNLSEAVEWLSYTYLYVRMLRNPLVYGVTYVERANDIALVEKRRQLIIEAAKALTECRMLRFDGKNFFPTDVGRVSSHYYIHHESVEIYNKQLRPHLTEPDILHLICSSKEFQQIKVRDEEIKGLEKLASKYCPVEIKGSVDLPHNKTNVLLQTYISNGYMTEPTLISDSYYITQSAGRITRALFEMALRSKRPGLAYQMLTFCKMIEQRVWNFQHPLRQFPALKTQLAVKLEQKSLTLDRLVDMEASEIGVAVRQQKMGSQIVRYVSRVPFISLEASVRPITHDVVTITVDVYPEFSWHFHTHGNSQAWYIWVEDENSATIYHVEYFVLSAKKASQQHQLEFTVPVSHPLPPQYYVKAVSDRWLGSEFTCTVSFKHLVVPEMYPSHTDLLPLNPLPVSALYNERAQKMYPFSHFNSIQTQVFHTLYHTDDNVLLGAPTGSGKTIVGELAMLRLFALYPGLKVVYVAPMKALARERLLGWRRDTSFAGVMGRTVVELTGDSSPDARALKKADIIITTPEKWDGVSRHWRRRGYVQKVGLVLIDEIHLLGQDRGPILEVIVSRMRYISTQTENVIRIVGLSTALSNARDLGDWLGIPAAGLFNFSPSVRPVQLTVHVSGFPGRHYCPRMATMNKPAYAAITSYSPNKPVLIFVSSRRQTRLTALDLITFTTSDGNPQKWMSMEPHELEYAQHRCRDSHLRHMLSFGIGMHHAGLPPTDRELVEELFVSRKIMVLVCTSTLAWGVNFPAHLVIVKGTEYFDPKQSRYVDFPITDVLQMMGRAGRPQFDKTGRACVFVHEPKKNFYLKFLHSPFPVESSLHKEDNLHNHLNAEIVGGTISSVADAVDWLTWTFFFRRLLANPSYYGLESDSKEAVHDHLLNMVRRTLVDLTRAGCVAFERRTGGDEDDEPEEVDVATANQVELDSCVVTPLSLGRIASYYYLKYTTVQMFSEQLHGDCTVEDLLNVLCLASEYDELPVRHNEDEINEKLVEQVRLPMSRLLGGADDPHFKAHLLLQSHFMGLPAPISDYLNDRRSVLDQCIRVMQAMVDVTAEVGWLGAAMRTMALMQMIVQGRWRDDNTLVNLPHVTEKTLAAFWNHGVTCLAELVGLYHRDRSAVERVLKKSGYSGKQMREFVKVAGTLPLVDVKVRGKREIEMQADEEHELVVNLRRVNKGHKGLRVHAPRLAKPKDEGWWLVLGDADKDELLALKRVSIRGRRGVNVKLEMLAPEDPGVYTLQLYLVSDSYLGLDQVVDVRVVVKEDEEDEEDGFVVV